MYWRLSVSAGSGKAGNEEAGRKPRFFVFAQNCSGVARRSALQQVRQMSTRTKRSIVHFPAPFALAGVDELLPAGDYAVDNDEEPIEGISWLAYHRVATFIHLPAIASTSLLAIQRPRPVPVKRRDSEPFI